MVHYFFTLWELKRNASIKGLKKQLTIITCPKQLCDVYWKFRIFCKDFNEMKSLPNGEITLSFTDVGESCISREFLTSQTCLLPLFAKIKLSGKFCIYSTVKPV